MKPVKVWSVHDDDEARAYHAGVEARLEEIGKKNVEILHRAGGLPTHWGVIVEAWLKGDKLEPESDGNDQRR